MKAHNIIGKITLYAKTENGYKNLTKLSSLSYLQNKEIEDPYCSIEDLISNNKDLIILCGNYRDFFGKLFQSNKIKYFEETIKLLKNIFHKESILKFRGTEKMMKKILRHLY